MAKKYYSPSDYPGMPKDGLLKTQEQKIAYEKWRATHPGKPSNRPLAAPGATLNGKPIRAKANTAKKK